MSTIDNILIQKYRLLYGLNNISYVYGNTTETIFVQKCSFLSNINIYGNTLFNNSTSLLSLLNINNNLSLNNTTILSNLFVSNNSIINNNLYTNNININENLINNNNLNVLLNSNLNNTTLLSNLNVLGNVNINSIFVPSLISNNLNINSNKINIGTTNSIINLYASSTYVANSNLYTNDKLLIFNINASTLSGFDNGNLSGIEIYSTGNTGFIKSSLDAQRFIIQSPYYNTPNYILIQDNNNNLYITGNTLLYNNVSINSSLLIKNNLYNHNNIIINNNLYISNNSNLFNTSILSSLYITNNSILNNLSISSSLQSNNCNINNISINSSLFVSNNTILNNIIINSNIQGNTLNINNNTTINNKLCVSNNSFISGNTTLLSILNISSNTLLNNISTISNLYVLNNSIFNKNISINSSLLISGISNLKGNVSIGSLMANINILSTIQCPLNEYLDNISARIGGIPINGFYRTGGMVKIRLNDNPPIIYFSSGTTFSIDLGSTYTDKGGYALDYYNNNVLLYLNSILLNSTNYLSNNILISGTSTLITNTSSLLVGTYTLQYQAQDTLGNIGYNTRTLNIVDVNKKILFSSSTIDYSVFNVNPNQQYNGIYINNILYNQPTLGSIVLGQQTTTGISKSYLQSINFDFNKPWTFIFRTFISFYQNFSLLIDIYDNLYANYPNNPINQGLWSRLPQGVWGGGSWQIGFGSNNQVLSYVNSQGPNNGLNRPMIQTSAYLQSAIQSTSGVIIELRFSNVSNYRGSISMRIYNTDTNNTLIFDNTSNPWNNIYFGNRTMPFALQVEGDYAGFLNGMLLNNIDGNITYQNYKSVFNL